MPSLLVRIIKNTVCADFLFERRVKYVYIFISVNRPNLDFKNKNVMTKTK